MVKLARPTRGNSATVKRGAGGKAREERGGVTVCKNAPEMSLTCFAFDVVVVIVVAVDIISPVAAAAVVLSLET